MGGCAESRSLCFAFKMIEIIHYSILIESILGQKEHQPPELNDGARRIGFGV